ncbi:MAG: aminodeoxychorismate synthase component I [Pseudomonadota bacterium]
MFYNLTEPFVLLDDARCSGAADARLFTGPIEIAAAAALCDVPHLVTTIDAWTEAGDYAAGFLTYEAGQAFEPRLMANPSPGPAGWPYGWFGRFAKCQRIAAETLAALLPDPRGAMVNAPQPNISMADYERAITKILDHIAAGDIYQANLTFNATVQVHGHPLSLYARLRGSARAGYGGIVFTGTHWLLSFSPELFFSVRDRQIITRPMKGTAVRRADPIADAREVQTLTSDPKQRAENLMIVDLLRNDLSRIAVAGSVHVPTLFRVETYPTIHQMVSDVAATLPEGTKPSALLSTLFPCGSITGAPKIRAMQIIAQTEAAPRGAYTGSIGFFAPANALGLEAAFNVAIRTLMLREGDACATLGLGSGVVADSTAHDEWQECLAKGEFVRAMGANFDLIETMRFDPHDGVLLLDRHLARLGDSARALGFSFDRHAARNMLQHATFRTDEASRVRLRLSPRGNMAVEVTPMPPAPDEPVTVALAPLPVCSDDVRLSHKTSDRTFFDDAREAPGAFEVAFIDPQGHVTEGSFTTVFVPRDGVLLTPPLTLGLLPGVLRAELIASGKAREAMLTAADLTSPFFIGNALRGLIRATLV